MGSVVLVADETVAARRDVVYGLFGAGAGAGWSLPRNELTGPHHIRQQLHPAEASAGGFRLLDRHACEHLFIQLS